MLKQYNSRERLKIMAIEAALVLLLLLAFKATWAVYGLIIGALAGIFNYWLVAGDNFLNKKQKIRVKNPLGSYIIRLLIALTVITYTGVTNQDMLFGALFGLTLEMQTYLWDAIRLLFRSRK